MRLQVSDPCGFVSKLRTDLHFLALERLGNEGKPYDVPNVSPILRQLQVWFMGICHQPIAKQDLQLTLRNSEIHTGHWRSRRPAFGRNLWSSQTGQNIKYLEIPSSYLTGQNGAVWENLCPPQIAFAKACRCLAWKKQTVFLQFIPNPQWVEINKMWKHANNQS